LTFTLQEATPGLFILDQNYQGAVMIAGTNLIARTTTADYPSRPANIGEYLAIFGTGLGPLQEVVPVGTPAPTDHLVETIDHVVVVIGNVELAPVFSGAAPGEIALNQVNVELTQTVPIGDAVPLFVKVALSNGTVIRSNTVTVAIYHSNLQ
jgi:uncharacterized protein (TIGR03437 family)